MPIRPEYRWLYPIDWPQLSALIRFERAKGRCEGCRRPHGQVICHLGDGRWWDPERGTWRDGQGRALRAIDPENLLARISTTRVILATAHRDHDPTNNRSRNLVGVLPEVYLRHDREEHRRRRWLTLFRRKALGDLFLGRYR